MKRLTVFCGSSTGAHAGYQEGARQLGKALAKRNMTLVYGGASVGMMGVLANAVLENSGEVIGVMPKMLEEREISHPNLSDLLVVETMHERKAKMSELGEGFIALPGGPGTLEEFMEMFTQAQLGAHQKPCGLLNLHHYYDPLINLFNHMADQQFLPENHRSTILVDHDPESLLEKFNTYQPPAVKTYSAKDKQKGRGK
ncbi:cytokinin riboside 5'-monophosphate phosphoribohydrolase [Lentibacillus kapialis]|uniref:Cytokinin riboside 5'-monophosphate phosphoribohydrolase n=1 Tax=Lentibacillus kapialis TaxID=340214 RepID=A0A917UWS0_9BACI|nr:TIGR00730 family Rossman fold protein [Lentibacillus kapialis]GGJ91225.1 cytokinin riboside 5'-monophosphate phosphoribohydrolase [Lentibacillus kapialis]